MLRYIVAALPVITSLGCHGGLELECGVAVPVEVMSYNLANRIGDDSAILAVHVSDVGPDFLGAQECAECEQFVARLPPGYQLTAPARSGTAVAYDGRRWRMEDQGALALGANDDGWGQRWAVWGLFSHLDTGHCVYVYATHWCVPVRAPDDACDDQRQLEYADAITRHMASRAEERGPVLLLGDFNVFDGFEDSAPVRALLYDNGMTDVFRVLNPNDDGTTFQGNDFAPAGRIDYVFATEPVAVLASSIDRTSVPVGLGSDHYAVIATVEFEDNGF